MLRRPFYVAAIAAKAAVVPLAMICALAVAPRAAAEAPIAQPSEHERLERGEAVVATDPAGAHPRVRAAILIAAPVDKVWEVMVDCPHAPEFAPGMKECKVLERKDESHAILWHRIKISPLLPEITYTFRQEETKHEKIDFVRIAGDLKELAGTWTLEPWDDGRRTLVRYSVYLDPGFLVPQWLIRRSMRHDLPELLQALRTRVLGPGHPGHPGQ